MNRWLVHCLELISLHLEIQWYLVVKITVKNTVTREPVTLNEVIVFFRLFISLHDDYISFGQYMLSVPPARWYNDSSVFFTIFFKNAEVEICAIIRIL